MTRQDFKRQLDELRSVILSAVASFAAWRGLMVEDEESARALDRYRGLFVPAREALRWMTLMQLAKVFDRDPRTVSLRNLLNAAMQAPDHLMPHACREDLENLKRQVDANEALLERLKRARDQRIAHYDAIAAGDRSLMYGELHQLVEDVTSMHNFLSLGHERGGTAFESLTQDVEEDTSEVVRIMREELHKAIRPK